MGAYGLIRFAIPLFPDAVRRFVPLALALAIIGILYGGVVAAMQRNLKRLVAYSSVAHLGFVTLGVFVGSLQGMSGASFRWSTTGFPPAPVHPGGIGVRATPHVPDHGVRGARSTGSDRRRSLLVRCTLLYRPSGSQRVRRRVLDPARDLLVIPVVGDRPRPSAWCWPPFTCFGPTSACSRVPSPMRRTRRCATSTRARSRCLRPSDWWRHARPTTSACGENSSPVSQWTPSRGEHYSCQVVTRLRSSP